MDRTNELLLGENPEPPGFHEHFLVRVQAYTPGYNRKVSVIPHLATALGVQFTFCGTPSSLNSVFGSHPMGVALLLRVRPIMNR